MEWGIKIEIENLPILPPKGIYPYDITGDPYVACKHTCCGKTLVGEILDACSGKYRPANCGCEEITLSDITFGQIGEDE